MINTNKTFSQLVAENSLSNKLLFKSHLEHSYKKSGDKSLNFV